MIHEPIERAGYTLTQIALAIRFQCDPSTLRRRGDNVSGYVNGKHGTWREHWKARRYQNGSLHGYEYVRRDGAVERVNLVTWVQDRDTHMLKSVLGNLQEFQNYTRKRLKSGEVSMLGLQVLADNISWVEDLIERADRPDT